MRSGYWKSLDIPFEGILPTLTTTYIILRLDAKTNCLVIVVSTLKSLHNIRATGKIGYEVFFITSRPPVLTFSEKS